jgi:hypothetical protein
MRSKAVSQGWSRSTKRVILLIATLLSIVALQVPTVRQLFCAWLFFAIGFGILFLFFCVCYLLGTVAERGWKLTEQEAQKMFKHRTPLRVENHRA